MGNTCKPMAVSFQCMTKSTTKKKKKERVDICKCVADLLCHRAETSTTSQSSYIPIKIKLKK